MEAMSNNSTNRIAVRLQSRAERAIKKRHPWIFENAIDTDLSNAKSGDLAIIFNKKSNKLMAVGLIDPYSTIRIRIVSFFASCKMDASFFQLRLSEAHARRQSLISDRTTAYRWIYGENDAMPGLIVDVYGKHIVIKLYTTIWIPYLDHIITAVKGHISPETLVLRTSRNLTKIETFRELDGSILYGHSGYDGECMFLENNIKISCNVLKGHKTGFFLDHRHNRIKVGELSKGRRILDLFAYAGGFSLHALAGGAIEATAVDISQQALDLARANVRLNFPHAKFTGLALDVFKAISRFKSEQFDLIIVDPPSFAKRQEDVDRALKAYYRLFASCLPLVAPKGIILLASCSSRISKSQFLDIVSKTISTSHSKWHTLGESTHDLDHPHGIPELDYLKSVFLQRK